MTKMPLVVPVKQEREKIPSSFIFFFHWRRIKPALFQNIKTQHVVLIFITKTNFVSIYFFFCAINFGFIEIDPLILDPTKLAKIITVAPQQNQNLYSLFIEHYSSNHQRRMIADLSECERGRRGRRIQDAHGEERSFQLDKPSSLIFIFPLSISLFQPSPDSILLLLPSLSRTRATQSISSSSIPSMLSLQVLFSTSDSFSTQRLEENGNEKGNENGENGNKSWFLRVVELVQLMTKVHCDNFEADRWST